MNLAHTLTLRVEAVLTGSPRPLGTTVSAIAKSPVVGSVRIGWLGVEGDHQADPVHHGGWDKAVHVYPRDHHAFWSTQLGDGHPLVHQPGSFGENIATWGATEEAICLGDRFSLGSVLLEVSHGRQPCSKLNMRFADDRMLRTIVETGRSGYYCRVLREGEASADDVMTLEERPFPQMTVARLFALLIGGEHRGEGETLRWLAEQPVLAEVWRERAGQLARIA